MVLFSNPIYMEVAFLIEPQAITSTSALGR